MYTFALRLTAGLFAAILFSSISTAATLPGRAFAYTPIAYPGALSTEVSAIDGHLIVGSYRLNGLHGFVFDGQSFTTLDFPGGGDSSVNDIDGDTIVGSYGTDRLRGYRYRDGVFSTVEHPEVNHYFSNGTYVSGISDQRIVGTYLDSSQRTRGFIYDAETYQSFDYPNALLTTITGVDGNRIVGGRDDGTGYLFDGTSFTTIFVPGSTATVPLDVYGNTVVGYAYYGSQGQAAFVLRDGKFQLFKASQAEPGRMAFVGVWGNKVVGDLATGKGGAIRHIAFVATIPEPSCAVMLTTQIGILTASRRWMCRSKC